MALGGFGSPWGELTSQTLRSFLESSVRISRDDIGEARDAVVPEVERILQGVREADPRFATSFQRSGSYIEGLKVSEPDEFDFLVPLMKVPKLSVSPSCLTDEPPDASFVPVELSNRAPNVGIEPGADLALWQWHDVSVPLSSVNDHPSAAHMLSEAIVEHLQNAILYPAVQYLRNVIPSRSVKCLSNVWAPHSGLNAAPNKCLMSPKKVMGIFKERVTDVISRRPGRVTVQRMSQGTPAVTFTIPYNGMEISVDLVPFIKNPFIEWSLDWPRPGALWPSQPKIDAIKATGVDLVAKHELYWRYSFSRIERVLLENIDEDGGQRRNSLRILKKVRQDHWKPKFRKNALVSYHLKNVLFWACEKHPYTYEWQDLAESFKRLVDMLIDFLSEENLPLFFLRNGVNLFKAKKEVLNKVLQEVLQFKASPMHYLK